MTNPLLSLLQTDDQPEGKLLLATVYSVDSGGLRLLLDGQTEPTQKRYKKLSTYGAPLAGDRVVCMKMSGTYVVLGSIDGTASLPGVNTVFAGAASGNPAAAAFRSLVAADLPIVPINKGGTGQNGLTVITDPTEVFTMPSGFECNWVYYAEWGKLAMVTASFKAVDAVTTNDWTTWATLNPGKRPPTWMAVSLTRTSYCTIKSDGEIRVSSTVNANSNYTFSAVYLLP